MGFRVEGVTEASLTSGRGEGWGVGRGGRASNLGQGWNFMWDGQARLGHPPWEGGRRPAKSGLQQGRVGAG